MQAPRSNALSDKSRENKCFLRQNKTLRSGQIYVEVQAFVKQQLQ